MKRTLNRDRAPLFPPHLTARQLIYAFVVCESEYQGARARHGLAYRIDDAMITIETRPLDRISTDSTRGERPHGGDEYK